MSDEDISFVILAVWMLLAGLLGYGFGRSTRKKPVERHPNACHKCNGAGMVSTGLCEECGGTGDRTLILKRR